MILSVGIQCYMRGLIYDANYYAWAVKVRYAKEIIDFNAPMCIISHLRKQAMTLKPTGTPFCGYIFM